MRRFSPPFCSGQRQLHRPRCCSAIRLLPLAAALAGCATSEQQRVAHVNVDKPCYVNKLGSIPVKLVHGSVIVPFTVNGVAGDALLDTGSVFTMMTPDFADSAEPMWRNHINQTGIRSITGTGVLNWIHVKTVAIGDVSFGHRPLIGVAAPASGKDRGNHALVGRDYFDTRDFDLDLAHGVITAYSTENCLHAEPLWNTKYTGLAMTRSDHDLIMTIPVVFEGGTIEAQIDTGAQASVLSRKAALLAGATSAELQTDPKAKISGGSAKTRPARKHRFAEVAIGEELLKNFVVDVLEPPPDGEEEGFDMILGMDYLARHHIWLSYSTNALYIDSGEPQSASRQHAANP